MELQDCFKVNGGVLMKYLGADERVIIPNEVKNDCLLCI